MVPGEHGYKPQPGYLPQQLTKITEQYSDQLPNIVVKEYSPLLDSANINLSDWHKMAEDIEANYHKFDGFVILHGTDTMAYSASALSFTLEDLNKPVIFTGSQIPLGQIRSDALDNIIGSLIIAGFYTVPEVAIYFHNELYRGNRCQKVDANGFHAFSSPNYPPLAKVGIDININHKLVRNFSQKPLRIQKITPPKIAVMHLFPGFDSSLISALATQSIDGIILRTYGVGNAPVNDKKLLLALEDAHNRGLVIVNCTQCYQGSVDMGGYETGSALESVGVISGTDMTTEAALAKLFYLFSTNLNQQQIEQQIGLNIRGELSPIL